ncbi:MAG: lipid-transfer protein [Chloroflexi bacterium]|jgi:acetyl-CoA acetyltransferase|nr:lipid-transfer protein [Chloroflexota bacterium]
MELYKEKTAIVGIGVVPFSTDIGRTEWYTACQAVKLAVDDAGLDMKRVDGLVKNVDDGPDQMYVQKGLGMDNLTYTAESHWGTSPMMNAITAVASGSVNYAVYYQTAHRASGPEKSISDFRVAREMREDLLDLIRADFYTPFGLIGQPGYVGMTIRRYMHEFNVTPEQMGWVPVVCSENAARNTEAVFFDKSITIQDYINSKVVVDPIRELDCAPKVDGSIAIIVTTLENAKSLRHPPAIIMAATQGTSSEGQFFTSYMRDTITELPEMQFVADELYRVAGIGAKDVKVAQLDDSFAPLVPMQLEALGFCDRGEGAAFCEGGDRIRNGGQLPLNTAGGALGQGRFDSARIVEAVRQVRGTSANQVKDADMVLSVSGAGGPADGLILRRQ